MKNTILFSLILSPFIYFSQVIEADKVNLFTLKIDYDNPVFEGGNLAYFDCSTCTNDSLPFDVTFNPPGDFGDISFSLSESQEAFFEGTIIWMGEGQITHPQSFSMEYPFVLQQLEFLFPDNTRVYDTEGNVTEDAQLLSDAETAWISIKDLFVVREATENGFKAGMYLYTPSVGMTDWSVAKWIVFLYKNMKVNSLEEIQNGLVLYPNPAQNQLKINMSFEKALSYKITNLDGKIVNSSHLEGTTIDVSELSSGSYFLELSDGSVKIKTMQFQKF